MAETPESRQLARQWSDISVALGLGPVAEAGVMTRGAGDIAFVAPYVPGLVGVGLIGAGMHAEGETAQLDSLPRQAKRNAVLMERLIHTPAGH
jgi:glutamate carboxypeptidase